jgi:hypothetical protein
MHGRGGKSDSKTRVLDFRHKSLLGKNLMSLSGLFALPRHRRKSAPWRAFRALSRFGFDRMFWLWPTPLFFGGS